MSMNRVVRVADVLAAGVGIAVLGGCAGAEGSGADEPLANYLGYSPLGDEYEQTVLTAAKHNELSDEKIKQRRAVEDFVVSCMRDEGFEYVPDYPKNQPPGQLEVERYGYGDSTFLFNNINPPEPNEAIRNGLSPEAQKAYDHAQWGDVGNGGCRRKADKEVNDDANAEELQLMDEFKGLSEDISRLRQRLDDDPRMRETAKQWADCLADGGYPGLEQLVDARSLIAERLASVKLRDENGNVLPNPDLTGLKRAVATADLACKENHVAPVRMEVGSRLEKQFVAEHKAELERFRDRAGEYSPLLGIDT